jgi:hypothetical protein
MLQSVVDAARRAAGFIGAIMNLVGAALFVAPLGLPADYLAAGVVVIGTGVLGIALRDQHNAIRQRDAALDVRANVQAGLAEFRERLEEGNRVRQQIYRWPRIESAGTSAAQRNQEKKQETERRMAAYREAVKDWKAACELTLNEYLPHRTPIFTQRVSAPPREPHVSTIPGLAALRWEADQRWERLNALQREFADQSSRAAISPTVQT